MNSVTHTPVQTPRLGVTDAAPRRALASRHAGWARQLARWLAHWNVRPNTVSMAGLAFAASASLAFIVAPELTSRLRATFFCFAAVAIQLRLLCNLLDGMLAIEHGLKGKSGAIFNEMPDRVADVLILVGAGYSVRALPFGVTLGWAAAVLALFTAYLRVLAGSLGLTQHFIGPMAKQHRMFVLTLAALGAAADTSFDRPSVTIYIGLAVIAAGSIATAVRRTHRTVSEANAR